MPSRDNHYVPQFYLRAFQDPNRPGQIWVYEKGSSERKRLPIKRVAKMYDYYTFKDEKGQIRDDFERLLSEVEGSAAPIITRWATHPELGCLDSEREPMANFLAFFHCRSPRSRQDSAEMTSILMEEELKRKLHDPEFIDKFLSSLDSEGMTRRELDELKQMVDEGGHFKYEASETHSLGISLGMFSEIAYRIVDMSWSLLKGPNDCILVTSDSPLSVFDVRSDGRALVAAGFGLPSVQITLPISPEVALRASWNQQVPFRSIDAVEIGEMNNRVVAQTDRFVFASQLRTGLIHLTELYKESMRTRFDPDRVRVMLERVHRSQKGE